jgi:peptidoglycan hydrolase-like protein with peptidoglycan-binding domain
MHKVLLLILLVLPACASIENLDEITNGNINKENNVTTIALTEATSTTTTLLERCIQESNKDRSLETTKDLQEFLSIYGFYIAEIDGKFGPQTETALRKFQEVAKIKVDGKFGPETKSKIRAWTGCES